MTGKVVLTLLNSCRVGLTMQTGSKWQKGMHTVQSYVKLIMKLNKLGLIEARSQ